MTQYSVRNCGLQGRLWLIRGPTRFHSLASMSVNRCSGRLAPLASPGHERAEERSSRRRESASTRGRSSSGLYVRVLRTVRELHANAQWNLSKERDLAEQRRMLAASSISEHFCLTNEIRIMLIM